MIRSALILLLVSLSASPLSAKDSLGVFSDWGAFRDDTPLRCYAIAKPTRSADNGPFASIANWPNSSIRGQLHIRLSRAVREGTDVTLRIGDEQFTLAANSHNAWATDTRMDAAVVAAMRSAGRMSISARDTQGQRFTDRYSLSGASTAIDASIVGCATN